MCTWGRPHRMSWTMDRGVQQRTRGEIADLAKAGLDWVSFATRATDVLQRAIPFEKSCWHTVDPGTVLITGSVNLNVGCSGPWLAEHEYVLDDVNKFSFLARSGYRAGSLSKATHGNLSLSTRARDAAAMGEAMGDELRGAFVVDGGYWGGVDLIREPERHWFDDQEVRFLASLSSPLAEGFRRAILSPAIHVEEPTEDAPGIVVLGPRGDLVSMSAQAKRWIGELVEEPPPLHPHEARAVQVVAARARHGGIGGESDFPARVRTQTRSGRWLLLYGTCLSGQLTDRVAVIIEPAAPHDVAPLVAAAYGLSEQERRVTQLCLKGLSTKKIADTLHISPYTVQDHLKSIFEKTGVRTRAELVGQVFIEHYVSRLEDLDDLPVGWVGKEVADAQKEGVDR
jgi:DNA-binding CsgD family transcriptional regulator